MQSGGLPMEAVSVERLDHLGVVASVIKDLGLIEMIDARVHPHDQEEITTGEAVAGMIVNGLGFANRPLSLTPPFFANKPIDLLFSELALAVRAHEGIAQRFNHLATTSFSLTGAYSPDSDEHAIAITYGYS